MNRIDILMGEGKIPECKIARYQMLQENNRDCKSWGVRMASSRAQKTRGSESGGCLGKSPPDTANSHRRAVRWKLGLLDNHLRRPACRAPSLGRVGGGGVGEVEG